MPPKKQGDRISDLEEKLELVLKKLEMEIPPTILATDEKDEEKPEPPVLTEEQIRALTDDQLQALTRERRSWARNRALTTSVTTDKEEEYTPKNLRRKTERARSHTPMSSRHIHSTKDVLNAPGMQNRAQQILDLLNPQMAQGKAFDPYANKTARYAMPRMFLNLTAQKVVKHYKNPDDLTLAQYIEGFTRMIDGEASERDKKLMLAHLADVAVLLQDFPWEVVRKWTNSVISAVGQGEYKWADNQSIEKEKIVKLMGASVAVRSGSTQGKNACVAYSATKCQEVDSHGIENLHICSFCLPVFGAEHDHPVLACHKRSNYKKGKPDFQRNDRYERYDRGEGGYHLRSYDQQNQNRGRGSYTSYRQQNPRPDQAMWAQPPPNYVPESKKWQK